MAQRKERKEERRGKKQRSLGSWELWAVLRSEGEGRIPPFAIRAHPHPAEGDFTR